MSNDPITMVLNSLKPILPFMTNILLFILYHWDYYIALKDCISGIQVELSLKFTWHGRLIQHQLNFRKETEQVAQQPPQDKALWRP